MIREFIAGLFAICFCATLANTAAAAPARQVDYGRLPLGFEPNRGQADPLTEYIARGSGYDISLQRSGIRLNLRGEAGRKRRDILLRFAGARSQSSPVPIDRLPGTVNYFVGSQPSRWRTDIPTYAKIEYRALYPGVDLVYYGTQGRLEYDFVLAPGADPSRIRLSIGADGPFQIAANGDLLIGRGADVLRQERPVVYQQQADGSRKAIGCRHVLLSRNEVGFQLDRYDRARKLTIDPVLSYSTFVGGTANDGVASVQVDATGSAYITGFTTSTNFPKAAALQASYKGQAAKLQFMAFGDAFVAKLNPAGTALVFSTYLGGSSDDVGVGIALDGAGNVYVTGDTKSPDFPTTTGAFQTRYGGTDNADGFYDPGDAFVAKLNPTGSQLLYSTYLGGAMNDMAWGIAVDATGNAVVAGSTLSTNFPTTRNALSTSYHGAKSLSPWTVGDGFVVKLNPTGTALVYSTYLGGRNDDQARAVAVDAKGNAYVCGWTYSPDFPTTPGAMQTTFKGLETTTAFDAAAGDAFVTQLNPQGALVYSTFLGGSFREAAWGIAVDSAGNAIVTGATQSKDFPVTTGAVQSSYKGTGALGLASEFILGDVFVAKLNAAGTGLVFGTYLGGTGDEVGSSVATDPSGNIFVTGFTLSREFPMSPDALQPAFGGFGGQGGIGFRQDGSGIVNTGDAFLVKLSPSGTLIYSSFFGGRSDDAGMAVAVDPAGNAYVGGGTVSSDLKVSTGGVQTAYAGTNQVYPRGDGFIAKFDFGGKLPAAPAKFNVVPGSPTSGAPGATLSTPFVVEVLDAQSAPVAGVPVTFTAVNASVNPASATTDAGGRASTTVTLGSAGTATVTATIAGLSPVSINFAVTANSPAALTLSTAASVPSVPAGADFTYTFMVNNTGSSAAANLKLAVAFSGAAVQLKGTTITIGSCADLSSPPAQLTCTVPLLAAGASGILAISGTAQQVGSAQAVLNATWDSGTPQSAQTAVIVQPPAGSLRFALPVTKSASAGVPVAVVLGPPNLFLLTSNVEIYQGAGLTPQPPLTLPSGSQSAGLLALDLNGDQSSDLIVLDSASGVTTYLANGSGYSAGQTFAAGTNAAALATINLNGDANPDLAVISDDGVALFIANGDGTFTPAASFDIPARQGSLLALAAGRFTGGSLDDLVVSDAGGNIWLLPSDGNGGFGQPSLAQTVTGPVALVAGDFNGDQLPDLAVASSDSGSVVLLLGDGAGNLGAPASFSVGSGPRALAAADFNGDGILDLAVAVSGANAVSLLQGDGAGGFTPPVQYAVGTAPVAVSAADLDGDGKLDIAVANRQSRDFSVLLNRN